MDQDLAKAQASPRRPTSRARPSRIGTSSRHPVAQRRGAGVQGGLRGDRPQGRAAEREPVQLHQLLHRPQGLGLGRRVRHDELRRLRRPGGALQDDGGQGRLAELQRLGRPRRGRRRSKRRAARPTTTKRAEYVVDAQKIITDQLVWIPMVAANNVLIMNKKVTGAPATFVVHVRAVGRLPRRRVTLTADRTSTREVRKVLRFLAQAAGDARRHAARRELRDLRGAVPGARQPDRGAHRRPYRTSRGHGPARGALPPQRAVPRALLDLAHRGAARRPRRVDPAAPEGQHAHRRSASASRSSSSLLTAAIIIIVGVGLGILGALRPRLGRRRRRCSSRPCRRRCPRSPPPSSCSSSSACTLGWFPVLGTGDGLRSTS